VRSVGPFKRTRYGSSGAGNNSNDKARRIDNSGRAAFLKAAGELPVRPPLRFLSRPAQEPTVNIPRRGSTIPECLRPRGRRSEH